MRCLHDRNHSAVCWPSWARGKTWPWRGRASVIWIYMVAHISLYWKVCMVMLLCFFADQKLEGCLRLFPNLRERRGMQLCRVFHLQLSCNCLTFYANQIYFTMLQVTINMGLTATTCNIMQLLLSILKLNNCKSEVWKASNKQCIAMDQALLKSPRFAFARDSKHIIIWPKVCCLLFCSASIAPCWMASVLDQCVRNVVADCTGAFAPWRPGWSIKIARCALGSLSP